MLLTTSARGRHYISSFYGILPWQQVDDHEEKEDDNEEIEDEVEDVGDHDDHGDDDYDEDGDAIKDICQQTVYKLSSPSCHHLNGQA